MRLPARYPRIALFGVTSILVLLVASGRWAGSPVVATPRAEAPAAIASGIAAGASAHPTEAPSALVPREVGEVARVAPATPAAAAPLPDADATAGGPPSKAVEYGDRARRRVALTFDAGADVGYAAEILDILARERVVASFGLTGAWAEQNPALVMRIAAEGHQLINHTWSHGSFTGLSTGAAPLTRAQRWEELDRTEAVIQRIAGVSTRPTFRPPYGDVDTSVLADVGARGYTVTAMWAVDSAGWNGLAAPAIVERTLRLTSPGAILIFHVGSQSQDAAALPAMIRGLREGGYEFVSVAALAAG
ncbi:MAG: polysaccharide deacetylase family protein [Dehalococcoidia bacterium]|nr:polysaccharide deacetylase family protein [Dehalococcoidia bacterium]